MRLLAISDTHLLHGKIKLQPADVIIHAGDALNWGTMKDLVHFAKWWNALDQYAEKIYVPGNHDWVFERDFDVARSMLMRTHVLLDSDVEIGGFKFWGTPWQRPFCNWAFNRENWERKLKFAQIPSDVDVLISHAPPLGYRDLLGTTHLGDDELFSAIRDRVPRVHICGHIHAGYGQEARGPSQTVYNVSICNEGYTPINPPTVIDL